MLENLVLTQLICTSCLSNMFLGLLKMLLQQFLELGLLSARKDLIGIKKYFPRLLVCNSLLLG